MTTYLISLYSRPGPPPPELDLTRVMADLEVVNDDIRSAGGWVFAGGLGDLESATVIRSQGETVVTDGPFLEAKEHLGGISIVRAPDLDVVLGWATRIAKATGLPVEVRPFQGEHDPGMAPTTE